MISKLLFWQLHSDIRNILVLLTKLHHYLINKIWHIPASLTLLPLVSESLFFSLASPLSSAFFSSSLSSESSSSISSSLSLAFFGLFGTLGLLVHHLSCPQFSPLCLLTFSSLLFSLSSVLCEMGCDCVHVHHCPL